MGGHHTPGPWTVKEHRTGFKILCGKKQIAWVPRKPEDEGHERPNAVLLSEAPALLAAAESLLESYEGAVDVRDDDCAELARSRATIARAKGGSSG